MIEFDWLELSSPVLPLDPQPAMATVSATAAIAARKADVLAVGATGSRC